LSVLRKWKIEFGLVYGKGFWASGQGKLGARWLQKMGLKEVLMKAIGLVSKVDSISMGIGVGFDVPTKPGEGQQAYVCRTIVAALSQKLFSLLWRL
jgi:hypothetical protein